MDQNTTLKSRNKELLTIVQEWKQQAKKWKFHASHYTTRLRKVVKRLRKAHIKKLKVEGSGINIQIQK